MLIGWVKHGFLGPRIDVSSPILPPFHLVIHTLISKRGYKLLEDKTCVLNLLHMLGSALHIQGFQVLIFIALQ